MAIAFRALRHNCRSMPRDGKEGRQPMELLEGQTRPSSQKCGEIRL